MHNGGPDRNLSRRYQLTYARCLLFRRTGRDPIGDLLKFSKIQLPKVLAALNIDEQAARRILGHDDDTIFATLHGTGIRQQI